MRCRVTRIFMVLFLATVILTVAGCSRFSRPSDAEVIKAIEDSGMLKGNAFSVTSPLAVLEVRKQKKDGSWLVRVKMNLVMQTPQGKIKELKENTAMFRVFKTTDSNGHAVWKAVLGS